MNSEETADFAALVAREQSGLLRFAAALTGDPGLADDVVSTVLSRAWERWDRVGSVQHPEAYVRRMVVNEFLSHKRRQKRHVVLFDEYIDPTPDHAERSADRHELRGRLAALPSRQRAAIVLRYYEGLSDHEIAAVLGCADGTVRSLISRALVALRVASGASSHALPSDTAIEENSR
ncbi:SigE family RNA polymerase sigma factor [Jatrophihabitans endophyticus]|uniref:SigE family RNA polymerase sigma factor n=1 Tax=Jatrophihabitans endophyticus TaxID=1206085 RepID=UPI0026EBFB4E|nr:SigE family RNA polymerase sigma factor [Jatrophihabitans endophyticus]